MTDCQSAGASLCPVLVTRVCSVTAAWTEDVLTLLQAPCRVFLSCLGIRVLTALSETQTLLVLWPFGA